MKARLKNIFSLSLAFLLIFSCVTCPAAVSTDDVISTHRIKSDPSNVSDDFMIISSGSTSYSQDFLNAAAEIADGALNFEEKIYISSYNIKVDDISSLFAYVRHEYPELINISNSFSYGRYQSGIVAYVLPNYIFDESEKDKYFTPFYSAIDNVAAQAETLNSDFLKALFVHDYLVTNSRYATEIYDSSFDSKSLEGQFIYNAYGNLVNGFSVCQGYSFAYKAIMERLSIDVDYAVSDEMNHIWNTVTIDGNTYHTDVTFDDPIPDVIGRVYHTSFLCTDEEITASDHYDWITAEDISTQSYPTRFWDSVKSKICILGDDMFYTDSDDELNAKLVKRSADSNKAQIIPSTLSNTYWNVMDGAAYYPGSFSRIELLNDVIYYSLPSGVNSISVDGSNDKTVYTMPDSTQGRIYGFVLRNGKFYGEISTTPNESGEIVELNFTEIEDPTETPTDETTEAPTDKPTEPLTDVPTSQPTDPTTEPLTDVPTEELTEAPTEAPTETNHIYRVAGDKELCGGDGWNPTDDENLMVYNEVTSRYEKVYYDVAAENVSGYGYRIVKDGAEYIPDGEEINPVVYVEYDGSIVTIWYDAATGQWGAEVESENVPTDPVTETPTDEPTEAPTNTPTEPEYSLGDVDRNGKVTVADAVMIQKHIANIIILNDDELILADTDKNGKITVADAVMIQKYIANIITEI